MNTQIIELSKDIDELGENKARLKWKNQLSQDKFGQSYVSLCCGEKEEIDKAYERLFISFKDYEIKTKGCCGK
jgi:hypothetical protein